MIFGWVQPAVGHSAVLLCGCGFTLTDLSGHAKNGRPAMSKIEPETCNLLHCGQCPEKQLQEAQS